MQPIWVKTIVYVIIVTLLLTTLISGALTIF
ncbi:stressosome-associated protein Prli42 [Kroppenstedtia guangzhouensis]|nr:stressosome-associated protein Prli42 [Kroppenstedtia guangzhouensis]